LKIFSKKKNIHTTYNLKQKFSNHDLKILDYRDQPFLRIIDHFKDKKRNFKNQQQNFI